MELVEKILLQLKSRDIAATVLAVPKWSEFIKSPRFIKQFSKQFCSVRSFRLTRYLKMLHDNNYESLSDLEFHDILPSGHCVLCLLQPHLLCVNSEYCNCVDHRILWGDLDVIVWFGIDFKKTLQPWPKCLM